MVSVCRVLAVDVYVAVSIYLFVTVSIHLRGPEGFQNSLRHVSVFHTSRGASSHMSIRSAKPERVDADPRRAV